MKKIIVCRESRYRKTNSGVLVFPFAEFLKEIWRGELLGSEV